VLERIRAIGHGQDFKTETGEGLGVELAHVGVTSARRTKGNPLSVRHLALSKAKNGI
jgi:hypothetical protein